MDTDLLRTFIEVSKTRHFGRAAENLYLTQSAVSFRIRQLEQQLGVSLFARHRNNIQLTAAGEHLLPYAETILHTLGRAKQELARDEAQQHQLAVGAPLFCWEMGLQQWVDSCLERQPDLALRLETANREQLCRHLLERSLDLAILAEPSKIDEVTVRPLTEYQLSLVSRSPNLTASQLGKQPLIWLEAGLAAGLHALPQELMQRMPALQTGSVQQALNHLLRHGGVAYLPRHLVANHIRQGELHLVEGMPPLVRPLYLAFRTGAAQDERLEPLLHHPLILGAARQG